jgi:hypothetical protein
MVARLVLMIKSRHDAGMTGFILFLGITLAIGILVLRYGVDSRIDERRR